jgi:hypothetical protein
MAEGEAMTREPEFESFEEALIYYLKDIATEMKKIRKEINYANTKENYNASTRG